MRLFSTGAMVLVLATAASAQLVTENAGTLSPETPMAKLRLSGGGWRNVYEWGAAGEFHLGVHQRLELSLSIPLLVKDFEDGDEVDTNIGPGDASVGFKLNVHKSDGVMTSERVAVFGGVEFPTGKWDDTHHGDELPFARKLQLGSGTFDGRLGLAFTYISNRHRFSIDAWGQLSTERDDVRPGSIARVDVAYWYRLFPAVFAEGESGMEMRLVADAWYMYRGHTRGEPGNDAGSQVWIAPGVQLYITKWLQVEGSFGIPLYDNIRDQYGRAHWAAFVAVKVEF